ncbi:hypothetical protein [Reinekea sp. G2M2-21]|uniref:hypothetical protein n=1 Tax=Reinekea sp. G2M2-21 TaxID=2788942 RepID=UPI0018AAD4F3|nr:hypothetical protein [Reinekea sp. G2M2-21]
MSILSAYYVTILTALKIVGYLGCIVMPLFLVLLIIVTLGFDIGDANFPIWTILIILPILAVSFLMARIKPKHVAKWLSEISH